MVQAPPAAPTGQVYISYAPNDRHYAAELASALKAVGLRPWTVDKDIFPGDNWGAELGRALETSAALVAIVSPATIQSPAVNLDLSFTLMGSRYFERVIAIVLDGAGDEVIPWPLAKWTIRTTTSAWSRTCIEIANRLREQLPAPRSNE